MRTVYLMGLSLLCGCTGSLDIPAGPDRPVSEVGAAGAGAGSDGCDGVLLAPQPLRRLSDRQYQNTITDLFGESLASRVLAGSLFPKTTITSGFHADAEANIVNTAESNAIEDNAERIAKIIEQDPQPFLKALLPCSSESSVTDSDIDACLDRFITEFGERAYRRPLTDGERKIARDLYDSVKAEGGARSGWIAVMQLFVEAPALLYRTERGGEARSAGVVSLGDFEMASRLSYFLTDSMPDAQLFAAARAKQLHTREQIRTHAERLMDTPRFLEVLTAFHRDWLQLYALDNAGRDPQAFPSFTPELQQSLSRELSEYLRYVMQQGDGSLHALLTSTTYPLDATLAAHYGVSASGTTFTPVSVPERKGLFTLASFMASLSKADRTSPIHRGAFFQKEILCKKLPTLPGNIDTQTALASTATLPTARQRYAPLLEQASCSGCHAQFNPTGLAFEKYDAIGRLRQEENGVPIDTSGQIDLGSGPTPFANALELIDLIVDSDAVYDCYGTQWYRAALGRAEVASDRCALDALHEVSRSRSGDLRELVLAIVDSDAFMFRAQAGE